MLSDKLPRGENTNRLSGACSRDILSHHSITFALALLRPVPKPNIVADTHGTIAD